MDTIYRYQENEEELRIKIPSSKDLTEGIILQELQKDNIFYKKIQSIWIDLQNIHELNSLAISELLNLYNKFKKNNPDIQVHLINIKPQVFNIMQLVNVDIYFKIHVNSE